MDLLGAGVDDAAGLFVVGIEGGAALFELFHQAVDAVGQERVGPGEFGFRHFGGGTFLRPGDAR